MVSIRTEWAADKKDHRLRIFVHDTGSDISAEDLPFIFGRFWRGNKSRTERTHSGLGLVISKQLVQAHGGNIDVHSEVGKGATFHRRTPEATSPRYFRRTSCGRAPSTTNSCSSFLAFSNPSGEYRLGAAGDSTAPHSGQARFTPPPFLRRAFAPATCPPSSGRSQQAAPPPGARSIAASQRARRKPPRS